MFYFLTQNLIDEQGMADISGHNDMTGQYIWTNGKKFKQPLPLQLLELEANAADQMPDFFDTTVPVMSLNLLNALKEIGVNNVDIYPVIIKNIKTGEEHTDYVAVNFLGSIDAVNQDESEYEIDSFGEPEYESIVIDDKKVKKLKVFRLLTGPDLLVINKEVADYINNKDFKGIMITETIDYDTI